MNNKYSIAGRLPVGGARIPAVLRVPGTGPEPTGNDGMDSLGAGGTHCVGACGKGVQARKVPQPSRENEPDPNTEEESRATNI